MLKLLIHGQLPLAIAQAASAAVAALLVMLAASRRGIHLGGELAIAMARGIIQIVAVGSILLLLLRAPSWSSILLLMAMIIAAGATSARRAKGMPGAFQVSLWAIACGAGSVIAVMVALGVIDTPITALVPVGVTSIRPYAQASFEASLIPAIDNLRSLGIVWIPGLMAGMLLSGARPVYAAIYQFVVLAMVFTASGLTSLVNTILIRARALSPAQQLLLRPGA